MRGKTTGKWLSVFAPATLCVFAVLFCFGNTTPGRAAQSDGQNSTQNSGQGSASDQKASRSSGSRATNAAQQNAPSGQSQNGSQNGARNSYKPAKAVSAANVQYPFQTAADAIVVFDVSIGARGEVRKTTALQNVPPFTSAAEQSLKGWKFAPATQNDRPEDAEILVAFVFRHSVYLAPPPPFTPIFPAKESDGGRSDFIAPAILSVEYAGYPARTVAEGAVVVQATVSANGTVRDVTVMRDLEGGFAPLAMDAARQWRFQPALRNGEPVPSKVAIAFVFSSRAMNPF
jgi:TonB family protein